MDSNKPVGKCMTPEGEMDIKAFIRIRRDEREVFVAHLSDGSFAFETKSWLLSNDRREVVHMLRFSEKTMVMLMEALHLGAGYFGVDLIKQVKALADDTGENLTFEYGGNGEFDFGAIGEGSNVR